MAAQNPIKRQIRRSMHRRKLENYLGGVCNSCKTKGRLQFDHIDPKSKSYNISSSLDWSLDTLKLEANKCQILCIDCHGKKTATDRGFKDGEPVANANHSTLKAYKVYRCRCGDCRQGYSVYQKNYYKRRRLQHGTN